MSSAVRSTLVESVIPGIAQADIDSFYQALKSSNRILALCGAGLSAASGLPTFRGAGGLWRTHDAMSLATPEAFAVDPGLVWQFYSYRRHMALKADPNRAHFALAELAKRKDFLCISQNVDGLSQRANHPSSSLKLIHGSLFDVKCTDFYCTHTEANFTDPIVPALEIPTIDDREIDPTSNTTREEVDISDINVKLTDVPVKDLPHCPTCETGLLRPGVVWFGEALPSATMDSIEDFLSSGPKVDIMLVIGTSATVHPAAGYIEAARYKGARIAVINMEDEAAHRSGLDFDRGDWFFRGDAAKVVPEILKEVIGEDYDVGHGR
ncbi:DHS-like NAD/FAD-binding domain-containing protein [Aulographum hederae CBS 113979]|uniref:DHS-like NAD/FAD-binding domain-containing protein n=1 Tax=Aulographum hederae CBS 113979 TaxID=1176131 RepID=A0A6G1GJA9_9PEZI|nr:DHS-like NAD/FAD-binding domain-containing protein [Aulographum hederae CBS 113979]